ncbi:GGDEF and EAL domain-containing protein [Altererythrobacter sp. ZODW24]|uniref:putative bifunctional diguanylate cyclase/phosphodiesterase n=1 Tax=Altererythrobacter sp. ZODW24 TaxID=2185142 RepID=UPI000DF7850F|nr:GGDEF and EAL domain-containing protein [Altererythrobacter sp. ZODW24]
MAVLGFSDPEEGDWSRLRGLQYAQLAKVSFMRLLIHAIAVGLVVAAFFQTVHPAALAGWGAALAGLLFYNHKSDASMRDADRRGVSRSEIRTQAVGSSLLALVWCVPMALFPLYAGPVEHAAMWSIAALLIAGSALVLAAAPVGTIIFALFLGIAAMASFWFTQSFEMIGIVFAFVSLVILGTVEHARTYLTARIAEAGMVEKNEVVSLLLREFEENEADWLWQVDPARRVRSVSPRFAFALGKSADEIEGMPFLQLIAGESWETGQFPPSLHDLAERLKRRENFSALLVKVTIGATQRWWELSGTQMLDEQGKFIGFRGVGSDVTEQRESSEKIAYLARYDTLTGLPNRLMLTESLGEAMKYAAQWRTRCAFLMIDLDRFKAVNDSLGHLVGDRLLAQVSKRLRMAIPEADLCGRLGGDEFAVVIRDASESGLVRKVSKSIIDHLSQPYEVDNHTLYVGASVGSAVGPRDGSTVEELMRNADLALYRSKDEGGGEHFPYEPALHATAEERRQLEFSLRHALERDEMELVYQPVVNANGEDVVSFEALLRWHSKDHGFVGPDKFIPIAEDTRLIVPIGEWVLREACLEAKNWPSHIRIAVNVSGEQLLEPGFSSSVVKALSDTGLPPNRLEIEVTESIFLRDAAMTRRVLEEIMALGCSIALDDFGTGYSSLGYLRQLRFSTIKVDRTFVQGASNGHPESLAIIRAVVAMAQSLEMSTTAEGVETVEEAEMIRGLGCNKIQGYYFGRPMPSSEARQLFVDEAMKHAPKIA